jgi:hypothetical protein
VAVGALILGLLGAFVSDPMHTGSVRNGLSVAPGVVAQADDWPAQTAMPVVSVPESNLQTHRSATGCCPTEATADEGSGALLPPPGPGLERRRQGSARRAIHTEKMPLGTNALPTWRDGSIEHAGENLARIGSAPNGMQVPAMPDVNAGPRVDCGLHICLSVFAHQLGADRLAQLRARTGVGQSREAAPSGSCALGYFRQDSTAAARQLTRLDWDKELLSAAPARAAMPSTVIYGDAHDWTDNAWPGAPGANDAVIWSILVANHFFDRTHERDSLAEVLGLFVGGVHG